MSRKVDTTRTASGEEEEDNMFNIVNEDGPGTSCSLNNANLHGLDPTNPNSTVFSDNGLPMRSSKFDMMGGGDRHETISLSDEEEPDFSGPGR